MLIIESDADIFRHTKGERLDMVSRQNLKTLPGKPYPMGASFEPDGKVNFAAALHSLEECGVLLYLKNHGAPIRLPFRTGKRIGNI